MRYLVNVLLLFLFVLPDAVRELFTWRRDRRRFEGYWRKFWGRPPRVSGERPIVWFHAVSVGEVLAIRPLLARLRAERPDLAFAVSTSTPAGMKVARRNLPGVAVFYAPMDFTWAVRRVFRALKPALLVLVELELWPNLLHEARLRSVPVAVVNSRMNESELAFFLRWRPFVRPALEAVRWWGVQTEASAQRIRKAFGPLGAKLEVTGSLKLEGVETSKENPATAALRRLLGLKDEEIVFVAGSTHAPEEEMVLAAFLELWRQNCAIRLILVPRLTERASKVAALIMLNRLWFVHRSEIEGPLEESAPVTLVDTVGELGAIWGLAAYAFVGGSFCKHGGQNMAEPAAYGVPACFGPHVWNFEDLAQGLVEAGGAVMLERPEDLAAVWQRWLNDPEQAARTGANAAEFVRAHSGAVAVTCQAIKELLPATDEPGGRLTTKVELEENAPR